MSESVPPAVKCPQIVIGDEELFVAQVGRAIAADHTLAARYTTANRLVAV